MMRSTERLSVACLFLALFLVVGPLPASAQTTVWVVDALGLPGTDFTDVQPAVDAAASGDVILVKGRLGHLYGGFTIDAKTLVVAGELDDATPFPVIAPPETGPVRIRNLGLSQVVHLRGMSALSLAPTADPSLSIESCAGKVVLEELTLRRGDGPNALLPTPPALAVDASLRVTAVRAFVRGEDAQLGSEAGVAVDLSGASVVLLHVQVEGGAGANQVDVPGFQTPPTAGATGLVAHGSTLFVAGSLIRGGRGGFGQVDAAMNCTPSQDGGIGLVLDANAAAPSAGTSLDSALLGGPGGSAPGPSCPAGLTGAGVDLPGGTLTTIPVVSRAFRASSPVREGETSFLDFEGEPGDLAFLLYGGLGDAAFSPFYESSLHLLPIAGFFTAGVVPPGGQLQLPVPIAELGAGVDAAFVPLQGMFVDTGTLQIVLGDPSGLLLLDGAL